ncbi:AfsR/SARP family transcriptional regulator [Nonomuraea guangzhouensis]|uniref:BTAD domain-containing putative transcriptional regulator n=1 Tax=Nonomuraea guangzhouensis TaxID=1291555 RepID=A0ABW4FZV7_9ACTN|nr:AfsR/SARP family transcriptional regulator [Nonomuraea guangzhouensis]
MVRCTVLGTVTVSEGSKVWTPSSPKLRQILALLLSRADQVVTFESLMEELWDAGRPKTALTTAQTYVYQLRKAIDRELSGEVTLLTRPFGYLLPLGPQQLDVRLFQHLASEGRRLLHDRSYEEASWQLSRALDLWAGEPMADVPRGPLLTAYAVHLGEQRLHALELRIEADMRLGRHRELIGELKSLVTVHPHHEWFHGRLISALTRSGRRSEALQAYRNVRTILSDDLGLDPSQELQELQQAVLTNGSAPALRAV